MPIRWTLDLIVDKEEIQAAQGATLIGIHTEVAMVEFKKDVDRFSLMEVNGRFWGSLPLSFRGGITIPRSLIDGQPATHGHVYETGELSCSRRIITADSSAPSPKIRSLLRPLLEYGGFRTSRDHRKNYASCSDQRSLLDKVKEALVSRTSGLLLRRVAPFRDRLLQLSEIRKPPLRILALCYSNICRTPLLMNLRNWTIVRNFPSKGENRDGSGETTDPYGKSPEAILSFSEEIPTNVSPLSEIPSQNTGVRIPGLTHSLSRGDR